MRLVDIDNLQIIRPRKSVETPLADALEKFLKELPTVEAEPVRHGHWVEYPECLKYENALGDIDIVCSCCEEVFNIMDNDTYRFDYCPHCGAKMDERKEE